MGVGTSRRLGIQGAGVLGAILTHRYNETQLRFLGGKCRMAGMGRRLCPTTLPLPPTSCETVIAGHTYSTPNRVLTAPGTYLGFAQGGRGGLWGPQCNQPPKSKTLQIGTTIFWEEPHLTTGKNENKTGSGAPPR